MLNVKLIIILLSLLYSALGNAQVLDSQSLERPTKTLKLPKIGFYLGGGYIGPFTFEKHELYGYSADFGLSISQQILKRHTLEFNLGMNVIEYKKWQINGWSIDYLTCPTYIPDVYGNYREGFREHKTRSLSATFLYKFNPLKNLPLKIIGGLSLFRPVSKSHSWIYTTNYWTTCGADNIPYISMQGSESLLNIELLNVIDQSIIFGVGYEIRNIEIELLCLRRKFKYDLLYDPEKLLNAYLSIKYYI